MRNVNYGREARGKKATRPNRSPGEEGKTRDERFHNNSITPKLSSAEKVASIVRKRTNAQGSTGTSSRGTEMLKLESSPSSS